MSEKRVTFATKLGVIATAVGSAVGLGNIWRFPYETGQHGGAAFLLIYIGCILLLGIPVVLAEFIIGRGSHSNVSGAFRKLSPSTGWHYISYLGITAAVLIMSFYSVIAGWTMEYTYQALIDSFGSHTPEEFQQDFTAFTSSPLRPIFWTFLFLGINYVIINRGVQNGIEKYSNVMMPLLFLLLLVFCVRSITLPGAGAGLSYLFDPDFSKIDSSVVLGAMGQAFFSLSLGMGTLITYSSYFSSRTKLVRSATTIAAFDTLVAVLAGIIIFPAVFTFGISPSQGPELVFITLPHVFQQMPGAYIWSVLFFILLFLASLTSTISMCEISVAFFTEERKMSRKKASLLHISACAVLGVLCSLSFGVLSEATLFGRTVFGWCDFLSSNILLPLGGMLISIYVGWVLDKKVIRKEMTNNGELRTRLARILVFVLRYIAPTAIILIFLGGLGVF